MPASSSASSSASEEVVVPSEEQARASFLASEEAAMASPAVLARKLLDEERRPPPAVAAFIYATEVGPRAVLQSVETVLSKTNLPQSHVFVLDGWSGAGRIRGGGGDANGIQDENLPTILKKF